jgi:hypothetical protein
MVEETTAASHALAADAAELADLIARFKIHQNEISGSHERKNVSNSRRAA